MNGYRDSDHVIPGFNLAVFDVDGTTAIETVKFLLKEYKFFLHTTKRHTPESHRFRLIMPMSHILHLDAKDFKQFMRNVQVWLPFEVDVQARDIARAWTTHTGYFYYSQGTKLLDVYDFTPQTKRSEEKAKAIRDSDLSSLERWFSEHSEEGNRNNMLYRYGMCLLDAGKDLPDIERGLQTMNANLSPPLDPDEIIALVASVERNRDEN